MLFDLADGSVYEIANEIYIVYLFITKDLSWRNRNQNRCYYWYWSLSSNRFLYQTDSIFVPLL